jgi:Phytanoyl-CoA dioxygenase (PhyH)
MPDRLRPGSLFNSKRRSFKVREGYRLHSSTIRSWTMKTLTQADIDHFLQYGFVTIKEAFSPDLAAERAAACYRRLGIDPNDRSTWKEDRIHMGGDQYLQVRDIAPRVLGAMEDLLGEDRMAGEPRWSDHYIVNLAERWDQPWIPPGPEAPGWHKDGDFFQHFLDSPEQGLLVFVCWTDVVHHGGPTYVATDSVPVIAKFLAAHPEGVPPNGFKFSQLIRECKDFVEATGKAGDVTLLHPFTLHCVSQNLLRFPRIITNPPVSLKEPMCFDRADGNYSPVEQSVLRALGVDRYPFVPTGERVRIVPERVRLQQERMERERLAALAT